jgi:hypothetical protein
VLVDVQAPLFVRPLTADEQAALEARRNQLRTLLHQSSRVFDKPTSIWTLALAAEACFAEGITPRLVSGETIRTAIHALGMSWKRAKHWITSPAPEYAQKKVTRPPHPAGDQSPELGDWLCRRHGWVDGEAQLRL